MNEELKQNVGGFINSSYQVKGFVTGVFVENESHNVGLIAVQECDTNKFSHWHIVSNNPLIIDSATRAMIAGIQVKIYCRGTDDTRENNPVVAIELGDGKNPWWSPPLDPPLRGRIVVAPIET